MSIEKYYEGSRAENEETKGWIEEEAFESQRARMLEALERQKEQRAAPFHFRNSGRTRSVVTSVTLMRAQRRNTIILWLRPRGCRSENSMIHGHRKSAAHHHRVSLFSSPLLFSPSLTSMIPFQSGGQFKLHLSQIPHRIAVTD